MFSRFFSPIQHGVATECGTELITHHIELLLKHNPDWVVLKTDVKMLFCSISRQQIMKQIAKSFPDVYNHVVQMYQKVSPLVFIQSSTPVITGSAEGVHQGARDPLGPILFALQRFIPISSICKKSIQRSASSSTWMMPSSWAILLTFNLPFKR